MKILLYGAGIIGRIYASKLSETEHTISLLARGKKYEELNRDGIIIRNEITGIKTTVNVPLIRELKHSDFYDLIIVTVRLEQLESVLAELRKNEPSPRILFMQNNPDNIERFKKTLPDKHLFLGFPGVGGTVHGKRIDYVQIKQQKTTIGEIDGVKSEFISNLKSLFQRAGFKTEISSKMQDWLKTHAIFISCITASIINANGDSVKLANDKSSIRTMVQSINEGFTALESLNISIEPRNLKVIFMTMPKWFSILYWQKAMRSNLGKLAIAPHAILATEEMQLVAKKILAIVNSSSVRTPILDNLLLTFIKIKPN
jgi:2-dehydropantoate 2-reductase